jgi:hypothetical protein
VARNSIGDNHGGWARIRRNGESIAQRSWRSQRGDLGGGQEFDWRQPWRLGENQVQRGKHRTEATEGELGLVVKTSIGDSVAVSARN